VGGINARPPPCLLAGTGEGRARSTAGVEQTRKENDDEAIADASGRTCYGWCEKAGGAQVADSGKEERMGRGSIGEMHVGILRCWRESCGLRKTIGHFCYVIGICVVIGEQEQVEPRPVLVSRTVLEYKQKEIVILIKSLHCHQMGINIVIEFEATPDSGAGPSHQRIR